jgi:hypothetical protein
VKTGRLLKFHRPGGDVQAYLYQEAGVFRASVFVLGPSGRKDEPLQILTGPSESVVEHDLRAWVEAHFPSPAK